MTELPLSRESAALAVLIYSCQERTSRRANALFCNLRDLLKKTNRCFIERLLSAASNHRRHVRSVPEDG